MSRVGPASLFNMKSTAALIPLASAVGINSAPLVRTYEMNHSVSDIHAWDSLLRMSGGGRNLDGLFCA